MESEPPRKRVKTAFVDDVTQAGVDDPSRRSISPPARRRKENGGSGTPTKVPIAAPFGQSHSSAVPPSPKIIPSPIQLNKISDLPASSNADTLSLRDILGDPLIAECWLFNYLFDVDYLM